MATAGPMPPLVCEPLFEMRLTDRSAGYAGVVSGPELLAERYEMRDVLGCGGMAEVRDGWDTRLDRAVAIKLLHPGLRSQADVRARFEDEARSAARLTHPNVVAVHDFGEQDGTPYIVMERLPGRTLADVMATGPMDAAQVRTMLDQVLSALAVAHGAGVLHRDIKPSNILLSCDGTSYKVADFGIAKTGGAAHTLTGQLVGTIAYMSPERIRGAPASVVDDLYAVGVMAYEALVGHAVFPHDNPITLARAILDDPPSPLTSSEAITDRGLAAVVDRAMTRDPAARFAGAEQMRAALSGVRLTPPTLPAATVVLDAPTAPIPVARRRTRPALAAAGVLAAIAVAVWALAADPFSTVPPPQPVSTSTSVAPPRSPAPPPPPPVTPVVQQPVEQQPSVIGPVATAEPKPAPKKPPGNGKKGGNGNGKGNGKG